MCAALRYVEMPPDDTRKRCWCKRERGGDREVKV